MELPTKEGTGALAVVALNLAYKWLVRAVQRSDHQKAAQDTLVMRVTAEMNRGFTEIRSLLAESTADIREVKTRVEDLRERVGRVEMLQGMPAEKLERALRLKRAAEAAFEKSEE